MQSCVAYQSTSVPISEAKYAGRAKVTTTTGQELLFQNIELKNSIYYGVYEKTKKLRLDITQISMIYLQDVKKSKNQTIWLVAGSVFVIGASFAIYWLFIWSFNTSVRI